MEPKDANYNEMRILLCELVDGVITPERMTKLNDILSNDPEAVSHYIDFLDIQVLMKASLSESEEAFSIPSDDVQELTELWNELAKEEKNAPAIEIPEEQPQRQLIQKVVYPPRERIKISRFQKVFFAVSAAAALIFAAFIIFVPPAQPSVEVATLADQINVAWDQKSRTPYTDDRMVQGTYVLTRGYANIRFDEGAQITVEAPAELSLNSTGDMELFRGRIYAIVPEQAQGFTVKAGPSKIVDLGTEFGVEVDDHENIQLHITKGRTMLFAGLLNGKKQQIRVDAGSAKKIYSDGLVTDIKQDSHRFVRHIDSKTGLILKDESMLAMRTFVAYHDFGATAGRESTGNITTHHVGSDELGYDFDYSPKTLINFIDGSEMGVRIDHVNGLDSRENQYIRPPAYGTPAYTLFHVTGLNLDNGMIRVGNKTDQNPNNYRDMTLTLEGLNPQLRYDLALYGDRSSVMGLTLQSGVERFTLGSADAARNSSSTGIVDNFTTEMETLQNADAGHVVRWTQIAPGADGTITVKVDAGFYGEDKNIAYLSAMRLEALSAGKVADNVFKNK